MFETEWIVRSVQRTAVNYRLYNLMAGTAPPHSRIPTWTVEILLYFLPLSSLTVPIPVVPYVKICVTNTVSQ